MEITAAQKQLCLEIAQKLAHAKNGQKGRIVGCFAQSMGISANTAYLWLRKFAGFESGKKARSDRGKSGVDEETCKKVSSLVLAARRKNGKKTMSAKLACGILQANGCEISASGQTVNRAMRLYGVHPDQLGRGAPAGRARSLYPNHVWQIDASVCVLYHAPGGMEMLDERTYNAKKPEKLEQVKHQRIIRYIAADHFSGAFYLHYEQAPGENAAGILRTLIDFMADRGPQDPAHGVPEYIYTDNGSGNISSLVRGFCEQLGIRALAHMPNRANATGTVEQCQNLVECNFESRLRFLKIAGVEDLQKQADLWRRHFLAMAVHSRSGKTRNALWLTIPEGKLKTVARDVLLAISAWKDEERKVGGDFTISVNTRTSFGACRYDLRELAYHGLNIRDCVKVRLNPFSAPEITVIMIMPDGAQKSFCVKPMQFDEAGQSLSAPVFGQEYKKPPKTQSEKKLEQVKKAAARQLDIMADINPAPLYLGKSGQKLKIAKQMAEPLPMSRIEFARMMRREHPDIWNDSTSAACMAWLAERYPDRIPGGETDKVIARLQELFGHVHNFAEDKKWAV